MYASTYNTTDEARRKLADLREKALGQRPAAFAIFAAGEHGEAGVPQTAQSQSRRGQAPAAGPRSAFDRRSDSAT